MPTFTYEDENTGMRVRAESDEPLGGDDVDWLFGAAQKQANQRLQDGQFKLADDGIRELSKDERRGKIRELSAQALGMSPEEVDIDSGASLWERTKMDFLRDDSSRMEYIEKKYGAENVNAINVGGATKMFYRDPKSKKMTMVDEMGASLADITADIAGDVLPTAAAVGGAIGAVALTGATGGLAVPLIAAGGAALSGFGGGVAQDVASEVATGQDVDLGDIAGRRGKEALLGVPIDLATAGIGRLGAKALGKRMITKSAAEAKSALSDLLEKTGGDRGMLDVIPTSDKSAAARLSRLAKESEGLEASRAGRIHDQVDKIVEAAKGRVATDVPVEDVIMREADALRATMKQRKDEIARLKIEEATAKRAATGEKKVLTAGARQKLEREAAEEAASQEKIIDATIDRLIKKQLKGAERLRTTTGESIRKSVLAGKARDEKVVGDLYTEAQRRIKTLNDVHSLQPVANAFDKVMKRFGIKSAKDDAGYKLLEARLGKQVADDLFSLEDDLAKGITVNFDQLNSMVRRIENRVNWKKSAGLTQEEQIMKNLASEMRKVRDVQGRKQIGEPAWQAFTDANKAYRQRILPRTENVTERAGRRIAGGSDVGVSPEKIADEVLSSSQAIRQTIRSAENPNEMRKLLRGHYMSRIIDEAGDKTIKIDMDEIRPLFLKNAEAKAAADRLREINSLIKNRKINPRSITAADVEAVVGDPLTPSGKKAMELLKRRGAIEEAQSRETFKSLQKMAKGQQPIPEDIHAFVDEFVRLDARDMKQLLDRLPDEPSRNSLRRSALDHLLQSNEAGGQAGSRRAGSKIIFNPDTMFETLRKNEGKWRTALGGETYDDMMKSAKVLKATPIPKPTVDEYGRTIVPKADIGGGGGLIFYATGPVRWIGRKTMDILHGSGKISTMLESITASREVDEELFKKIILSSMATRRGMEAVADEADKDKNFEDWLNREIYGTEPDEE